MARPTLRRPQPIIGWNLSQARETAIKKSGMQIKIAPKKMANPATPDRNPPTRGMYPSRVVIGEKNRQIPATIAT